MTVPAPLSQPLPLGEALRDTILGDDPDALIVMPDVAAWDRAQRLGSDEAARAIARRDIERWIPGLPARGTYKVLGLIAVAAIVVDIALGWLPPSGFVDRLGQDVCTGTAALGTMAALWSILSEMRGWDGSDAATWFLKRRIDRTRKRLEARRLELTGTAFAVGAAGLAIYRVEAGRVAREPLAILGLRIEAEHVALLVATAAGTRRFDWLPRDPAFEAAVARLAKPG